MDAALVYYIRPQAVFARNGRQWLNMVFVVLRIMWYAGNQLHVGREFITLIETNIPQKIEHGGFPINTLIETLIPHICIAILIQYIIHAIYLVAFAYITNCVNTLSQTYFLY